MLEWLKARVARPKRSIVDALEYEHLKGKSFEEVVAALAAAANETFDVRILGGACRRLIEIGLEDEDVDMDTRKRALAIEGRVWSMLEDGLKDAPTALAAGRDAHDHAIQTARRFGVFSLARKI